jgi:uncharacterized protein YbcI
MTGPIEGPTRGALNAALANELGKLVADFTGRGATRSRALVHQDMVVCVLEDGATRAERNLVAAGRSELVRQMRSALHEAMRVQLIEAVERLTGRTVRTFIPGVSENGEASITAFMLEPRPSPPSQPDQNGASDTAPQPDYNGASDTAPQPDHNGASGTASLG